MMRVKWHAARREVSVTSRIPRTTRRPGTRKEQDMLHHRRILWPLALLLCLASRAAAEPVAVRFSPRTTIHLVDQPEGRERIALKDDFVRALSRFDLQSRLKTADEVKVDDLLELYRQNVTDWPEEDAAAVRDAINFVADRLAGFDLKLPEVVAIVRTTGKEESGAAYCRGPSIVLPANMLRKDAAGLRRLVAHELFHVLSTHDPELRRDLYAAIGFTTCPPIAPPKSLAALTIANPDAPRIDCTMELTLDGGERVTAAPILVASDQFDPSAGKTMFDYLQFRLLIVEKAEDGWRAVEADAAPRLIDPRKQDDFWAQIGRNTGYVIHPDEILAENFAHLVMATDKLPSPQIVEKMKTRLSAK